MGRATGWRVGCGMAVQFILGRSGTGKTRYCIEAVVEALRRGGRQSLILLVPEQATYQAERLVVESGSVAGYGSGEPFYDAGMGKWRPSLNILSFARLQFWLLGRRSALPELSRVGREMLVHKLLGEKADSLRVFGRCAEMPGLAGQIASTISELQQCGRSAEEVEALVERLRAEGADEGVIAKLADIGVIFREYLKAIEGQFVDPDVQLNQCLEAVSQAGFIRGARLWVDGFAGFTQAETAILMEMLKRVEQARIALCLDPSKLDLDRPEPERFGQTQLFYPTEKTYAELLAAVRSCGLEVREPVILEEAVRFKGCPALGHLERNIFEGGAAKARAGGAVRVVTAGNQRGEVVFVARQIQQLVRKKGWRYRDVAVVTPDIDAYEHYVRAVFGDYGIPFFIDKRRPLRRHPVVELVCSAVRVATGGFETGDVFSCLKTELAGLGREDVDLLENYCLACGINGDDWVSEAPWRFARADDGFDEERIDGIRRSAAEPLLRLRRALTDEDESVRSMGPAEFAEAVFSFLERLGVERQLEQWVEDASRAGDYATAEQHRQFYEKFVGVFEEMVEIFAGRELAGQEYLAILGSAFSQMELGLIPASCDEVLVGSIERSRHPDIKAAFIVGATQRWFPLPVGSAGLLSDDDRRSVESVGFAVGAGTTEKLVERQYLAYIAFTRASQYLCVTYPLADERGNAEVPSQFVGSLQEVFEDVVEQSASAEPVGAEQVYCEGELLEQLCTACGGGGDEDEQRQAEYRLILDEICADAELRELGEWVRAAVGYDNDARLDGEVAKRVFPSRIRVSATRLRDFSECPYKHFAGWVLELKRRRQFRLEPLDVGDFYHKVLDRLLKKLRAAGKTFATSGEQELLRLLDECIEELAGSDAFISNFVRRSRHNAFIVESAGEHLRDCVLAIRQMQQAGSLEPVVSEVWFGQVGGLNDGVGGYEVRLGDGRVASLVGKIDRLDVAEVDGRKAAVVFDYKRTERRFRWEKFYYGLDMQLPIYLLAVRGALSKKYPGLMPVGAFYMPVERWAEKADLSDVAAEKKQKQYKARGLFNGQYFRCLDKETMSGWSRWYGFFVTANGQQYGHYEKTDALSAEDFEFVLRFAERKIIELVGEITEGKIDVSPYRLGNDTACGWCDYRAVCRFDWRVNDWRFLRRVTKKDLLGEAGGGDD